MDSDTSSTYKSDSDTSSTYKSDSDTGSTYKSDSDTSSTYKSDSDSEFDYDLDNLLSDEDGNNKDYDDHNLAKILPYVTARDIWEKIPHDYRLISALYLMDDDENFKYLMSDIWSYHVPEVLLDNIIDLINSNDIDNMKKFMVDFEYYEYINELLQRLDYNNIEDDTILELLKITKYKYENITIILGYASNNNFNLKRKDILIDLLDINNFSDIDKIKISQSTDKINQYESEFIQFIDNQLYKTIKDYNSVILNIANLKVLFYTFKSVPILESYSNKHNLPLSNQYLHEDNYIHYFVIGLNNMFLKEENFKKRELLLQQRRYKRDLKGIK